MSIKHRLIAALVRIYPARWREEYGAELSDVLQADPLGSNTIIDVFWNGCWQRLRSLELATIFGLAAMLMILAAFAWNIAAPQSYGSRWTTLLEPSDMTFPTITVRPFVSELYVLFLVACGCVIHLQRGGRPTRSGMAAMKISFIAGLPIMAAGVLMLLGVMQATVLGPGDTPTTFREHGFAFTYYSQHTHSPAPLSVLLAPLARLPESWIWGSVGGVLGRWISCRRGWLRGLTTAGVRK
jgi:hypothetical protein